MKCGDAKFSALYIDVEYMDTRSLDHILVLAKQGLPICIKQSPGQPGRVKSETFGDRLETLLNLSNVSARAGDVFDKAPIVTGDSLPAYWCRVVGDEYYIFFAHPLAKDLKYLENIFLC